MSIESVFELSVDCAVSTISAVLGKDSKLAPSGIEVVPRLVNREEIVINMGFCNEFWQGLLTFGGSREDLAKVVGGHQLDVAIDALGEVLNGTAGMIAALPEAIEVFGELSQTTPVYMEGGAFYPKASSVQVDLLLDDVKLRFGFAIRQMNP